MTAAWELNRYVAKKARERQCPVCGVAAGSNCVTRGGRTTKPHSRRMQEAFSANVKIRHGGDG